jgi:hypothetical protein
MGLSGRGVTNPRKLDTVLYLAGSFGIIIMDQVNVPPDGILAEFVHSQKGTSLLRDDLNNKYCIYQKKKDGMKKVSLKCSAVPTLDSRFSWIVKINHSHNHTSIC